MIIHKEMEQCSEEWFAIRDLKFTASHASTIACNGKGLVTYAKRLFEEHTLENRKSFSTLDTERGNEQEPTARNLYCLLFEWVDEVGFIERDKNSGCSPDGLVGKRGGLEIKCPNDDNFQKMLDGKKPDKKYVDQCQMCLMITGREWWDLMFFNNSDKFEKSHIVIRIFPDYAIYEKLIIGIESGRKQLEELKKENKRFNI